MPRKTVMEVSAHIEKHEAVCTERWLETISRIKPVSYTHLTLPTNREV